MCDKFSAFEVVKYFLPAFKSQCFSFAPQTMQQRVFAFCCFFGLFLLCSSYTIPGVPDSRDLHVKISRSSGTGLISFGYAVVVLIALALFVFLMGVIICYKRDKTPRSEEKTVFLTRF